MALRREAFGFAFFKTMPSKLASDRRSSCLHSSGAGIKGMHSHTLRKSLYLDENKTVELTDRISILVTRGRNYSSLFDSVCSWILDFLSPSTQDEAI